MHKYANVNVVAAQRWPGRVRCVYMDCVRFRPARRCEFYGAPEKRYKSYLNNKKNVIGF